MSRLAPWRRDRTWWAHVTTAVSGTTLLNALTTDLAAHCRLLLHDRPKHTRFWRWGVLYPLYAFSEIAIIATDLAELLGSAIALCLLFPKLPLWAGVLITASDVFILLALRDPLGGRPVRIFEVLIAAMVCAYHADNLPSRNIGSSVYSAGPNCLDLHGGDHRTGWCSLG